MRFPLAALSVFLLAFGLSAALSPLAERFGRAWG
jgi:hypothetical protein